MVAESRRARQKKSKRRSQRKSPTVYLADPSEVGGHARKNHRYIILSTGRGDTYLSLAEAIALTKEMEKHISDLSNNQSRIPSRPIG